MDLRYCTGRTFPVKCRALKQDALVEREVVMRYSRLKPQGDLVLRSIPRTFTLTCSLGVPMERLVTR